MLRRRRSWERDTTCGVFDGTLSHVQGVGVGEGVAFATVGATGDVVGGSGGALGRWIRLAFPCVLVALSWKIKVFSSRRYIPRRVGEESGAVLDEEMCGRRRGVPECSKWMVPRIVEGVRDRGVEDVFVIVASEPQRDVVNWILK